MTIGKKVGRHSPRHGWSGAKDPEWQYRKTLDKADRDVFDYELDDMHRLYYVQRWIRRQEVADASAGAGANASATCA